MSELGKTNEIADELVMESVKEEGPRQKSLDWHNWVGLTTLLLALLAAIGALLAGITAHDAVMDRTMEVIEASNLAGAQVRVEVLKAKHEILLSMGDTPDAGEVAEVQVYESHVSELEADAAGDEATVAATNYTHLILAIAVTILSVAIALCGMAVVTEQKWLWIVGIVAGAAGTIALGIGIATMLS